MDQIAANNLKMDMEMKLHKQFYLESAFLRNQLAAKRAMDLKINANVHTMEVNLKYLFFKLVN